MRTMSGLKYYRRRSGMTQGQLADALGVQRATVAMWENGKSWPSAALLPQMADLLLCSIDDLYSIPDFIDNGGKCPCLTITATSTADTAGLQV